MADGRDSPKSIESEKALLGGLLLDPGQIDDIAAMVEPGDMFEPFHREFYALILEMRRKGEAIDLVTVPERIAKARDTGIFGGISYALGLADGAVTVANLPHYAERIVESRRKRDYLAALADINSAAEDRTRTADELRDWAAQRLAGALTSSPTDSWVSLGDLAERRVKHLDEVFRGKTEALGVSSRFTALTAAIGWMRPGQLIILAGPTAGGKSALALNIAWDVAGNGHAVGVFALEMEGEELADRTLAADANIDAKRFDAPKSMSGNDWLELDQSSFRHKDRPIFVDDTAGLPLKVLTRRARALHKRFAETDTPLGLLVIDYLQLIDNGGTVGRVQQVTEITRGLKVLAKELRVPVLALSQLSRAADDQEPRLSHLRESGSIEQDADVVLLLHPGVADTEVIVAKQRRGPKGKFKLVFNGPNVRFENPPSTEPKINPGLPPADLFEGKT